MVALYPSLNSVSFEILKQPFPGVGCWLGHKWCFAKQQAKARDGCAQDPSVAAVAGLALARVQRTMAHYVAVLTDPEYLANSRAVLEAKLPLLTQQVRARDPPDCPQYVMSLISVHASPITIPGLPMSPQG